MPFGGRYVSTIKNCIFAAVFAGAAIYGTHLFKEEKKQDGVVKKDLEQKISDLSSSFGLQISARDQKIIQLEDKIKQIENKHSFLKAYLAFNSSVQITYSVNGDVRISSGSVVCSISQDDEFFSNYVLCVSHAFEDFDLPGNVTKTSFIKVQTYKMEGVDVIPYSSYEGQIVVSDDGKGLAIVYFESIEPIYSAKIASREKLKNIPVLSEVFTIGCPLGLPVFKTNGELQSLSFSKVKYDSWLMNVPVFPGNSGGGVYLADTNELVGVVQSCGSFSINEFANMPVSHLSFMIPLTDFKDWLEENKLGFIYDKKIKVD